GWAADSVDTTMMERLKAMPYTSELWRSRYSQIEKIPQDEPAAPKGNLVARNICWGGRWDEVEGAARPYVAIKDNWVDGDSQFVETPPKSFRVRDNSPAVAGGFKQIPFEKIGLEKRP
ncbi:MAG: hypothetical protein ACM3VT_16705, partial [Solirubrobacterales bacterium]